MLDTLKERLKSARDAVFKAEADVEDSIERSPQRLAQQRLDEKKSDLASVELSIKLAELRELDAKITALLQERATLEACAKGKLSDVLPTIQRLDIVNAEGAELSRTALNLALDCKEEPKVGWRDPVLPEAARTVRNFVRRLEGK